LAPGPSAAAREGFVEAARAVRTAEVVWPERVRAARDGLASLYVRVGRTADAEEIFSERFGEEPDATVAISAARAFLEAGETARAVTWLERAAARARELGRDALEQQLQSKARSLRARLN
jgi:thioredoxin-like negative regulator of GroEL